MTKHDHTVPSGVLFREIAGHPLVCTMCPSASTGRAVDGLSHCLPVRSHACMHARKHMHQEHVLSESSHAPRLGVCKHNVAGSLCASLMRYRCHSAHLAHRYVMDSQNWSSSSWLPACETVGCIPNLLNAVQTRECDCAGVLCGAVLCCVVSLQQSWYL